MIHEKTTANDRTVHRSPFHCPLPACYRDACKQYESQEKGVLYPHLINFTNCFMKNNSGSRNSTRKMSNLSSNLRSLKSLHTSRSRFSLPFLVFQCVFGWTTECLLSGKPYHIHRCECLTELCQVAIKHMGSAPLVL